MKTKTTLSSAGIKKIFFIFFMLVTAAYGKAQDSCQTTKALFTVEKTTADCQHYSITNLSTGNNLTYHWSFSDGVQSTSANPGTHVFTEIGEHYLFLFIKDTLTNCTSFFSDTLECPCQAIFNSADLPNHIRTTQFLVYTDSIQKAFSWSFGDGSTSTLVNPIHQYPHEGTFTACLTVRSLTDTSCVDTQCKDVIVKDSTITSNCHAVFTTKTDSLDTHKILITNLSTGNNLSYIWNFGDGTSSTDPSPGSHTYTSTNTQVICLTITDNIGNCTSTFCDTVFETNCNAQFQYNRLYGLTYHFEAIQKYNATYLWQFGDGQTTTTAVPYTTHTYSGGQVYKTCLTVTSTFDSTCVNTTCNYIHTSLDQYCHAFYTIVPDSTTSDTHDFIIYNASTGTNLNYLWSFGDGDTSTLPTPTHEYSGDGPFMLCLTVTNDSCSNTYCDTILFSDSMPHMEPNKWYIKVIMKEIPSGIKENAANKTQLQNYPNPFSGSTTISYHISEITPVELSIFNLLGSKVDIVENTVKAPGDYSIQWTNPGVHEGIYLLQLKTNTEIITKKIIFKK